MTRTSTAPDKPSRLVNQSLELARQKQKIRAQKEEIDKLKRSLRAERVRASTGAELPTKLAKSLKTPRPKVSRLKRAETKKD
jgi:hypothetical protein